MTLSCCNTASLTHSTARRTSCVADRVTYHVTHSIAHRVTSSATYVCSEQKNKLRSSKDPIYKLIQLAYDVVEEKLLKIINTSFGSGYLVLLGGIQVRPRRRHRLATAVPASRGASPRGSPHLLPPTAPLCVPPLQVNLPKPAEDHFVPLRFMAISEELEEPIDLLPRLVYHS